MLIRTELDLGRAFLDPNIVCAAVVNNLTLTLAYWGDSGQFVELTGSSIFFLTKTLTVYGDGDGITLSMSEIFPTNIRINIVGTGVFSLYNLRFDPYLMTMQELSIPTLFTAGSNGTLFAQSTTMYGTCANSESNNMFTRFGAPDHFIYLSRLTQVFDNWSIHINDDTHVTLVNGTFACCQSPAPDLSGMEGHGTVWSCAAGHEELLQTYDHERYLVDEGCPSLTREECCNYMDARPEWRLRICVPAPPGEEFRLTSSGIGTSQCEPLQLVQRAGLLSPVGVQHDGDLVLPCPDIFWDDLEESSADETGPAPPTQPLTGALPPPPLPLFPELDEDSSQAVPMTVLLGPLGLLLLGLVFACHMYRKRMYLHKQRMRDLKELMDLNPPNSYFQHKNAPSDVDTVTSSNRSMSVLNTNRRLRELKDVLRNQNHPITKALLSELSRNNAHMCATYNGDAEEENVPQVTRNRILRRINNLHLHLDSSKEHLKSADLPAMRELLLSEENERAMSTIANFAKELGTDLMKLEMDETDIVIFRELEKRGSVDIAVGASSQGVDSTPPASPARDSLEAARVHIDIPPASHHSMALHSSRPIGSTPGSPSKTSSADRSRRRIFNEALEGCVDNANGAPCGELAGWHPAEVRLSVEEGPASAPSDSESLSLAAACPIPEFGPGPPPMKNLSHKSNSQTVTRLSIASSVDSDRKWVLERQAQLNSLKVGLPAEGDMVGEYRIVSVLGTGTNGRVYLAETEAGMKYALKFPFTSPDIAVRESYFLTLLDHSNIVQLERTVAFNSTLVMVLEYCHLGDLQQMLSAAKKTQTYFDESLILDWLTDIMMAMDYLHDQYIAHRDIKPANIFIGSDGALRLADFDTAKSMFHPAHSLVGTPLYMAPEVSSKCAYTMASDIWSTGALVYELCTLCPPFDGLQMKELTEMKGAQRVKPISRQQYTGELVDLVMQMLEPSPEDRPTAHEILNTPLMKERIELLEQETLETPFVKQIIDGA